MNFQEEINKWNELFKNNSILKSDLKRISKNHNKEDDFFGSLKVLDNTIYSNYKAGYQNINPITVKKIIDLFIKILKNEEGFFLIASDGTNECVEIIKEVINLNDKNIKFVSFSNFEGFDKKFISSAIQSIKLKGGIYLSKSIFDKNIIQTNLYSEEGMKINSKILISLINKISKNINDVRKIENAKINFLNNDALIQIHSEKITNILMKKTSLERKTKIAICASSAGTGRAISKIIGKQDFSYIIKNYKNKFIDIFNKRKVNDNKIKKYFWKEIFFARRMKANFLIIINHDGTQVFLFSLNNRKTIYLNSNLIALMCLNDLCNEISLNDKKITNLFISNSNKPNSNIQLLVNKYKISFKKYKKNIFSSSEYLLMFWNEFNQFVFGEKINDEFSIYHLIAKIIDIVDIANNQYNSIVPLIKKIEKMYGELDIEDIQSIRFDYNQINQKLDYFISDPKNKKDFDIIEKNNKHEDFFINDLWFLKTKNNLSISIKHNQITNKCFLKCNENQNKQINIYNQIKKNIILNKIFKNAN